MFRFLDTTGFWKHSQTFLVEWNVTECSVWLIYKNMTGLFKMHYVSQFSEMWTSAEKHLAVLQCCILFIEIGKIHVVSADDLFLIELYISPQRPQVQKNKKRKMICPFWKCYHIFLLNEILKF
jgi:hypothetical protein